MRTARFWSQSSARAAGERSSWPRSPARADRGPKPRAAPARARRPLPQVRRPCLRRTGFRPYGEAPMTTSGRSATPERSVHFDGHAWKSFDSGVTENLTSVYGSGVDEVWVTGDGGSVLRWDGASWKVASDVDRRDVARRVDRGPERRLGRGRRLRRGRLFGGAGFVHHWTGTEWVDSDVPSSETLWKVWGSGPTDVWLVGTAQGAGLIYRGNGMDFEPVTFTGDAIHGIWGSGPNDVWVTPLTGAIQHWTGSAWTAEPMLERGRRRSTESRERTRRRMGGGRQGSRRSLPGRRMDGLARPDDRDALRRVEPHSEPRVARRGQRDRASMGRQRLEVAGGSFGALLRSGRERGGRRSSAATLRPTRRRDARL